jgi:hypothetical protein
MKKQILKTLLLAAAGLLTLPFLAQTAHADSYVDFSCAGSACTGTVANNSGVYSSTGIGGLQQSVAGGPDYLTGLFTLAFNTGTDAVSMTGNAAAGNDTLLGTITNTTPISAGGVTLLTLTTTWTTLPADFAAYFNAPSGSSLDSVIYLTATGAPSSIDFTIVPTATPEPASVMLLGLGLLALCGLVRRKEISVV